MDTPYYKLNSPSEIYNKLVEEATIKFNQKYGDEFEKIKSDFETSLINDQMEGINDIINEYKKFLKLKNKIIFIDSSEKAYDIEENELKELEKLCLSCNPVVLSKRIILRPRYIEDYNNIAIGFNKYFPKMEKYFDLETLEIEFKIPQVYDIDNNRYHKRYTKILEISNEFFKRIKEQG